jgi:hypothetical protein
VVMLVAVATALASAVSAALLIEGKKPKGSAQEAIAEEKGAPRSLEP